MKRIMSRLPVAVMLVLFAGVGVALLRVSHATTPVAVIEPENGVITTAASRVSDTAASGAAAVRFSSSGPAQTVKLMPLGDSITDGYSVLGGYRTLLYQKLVVTDHDNIDFVGSLSGGPSSLADKDHEGHTGWCVGSPCRNPYLGLYIDGWLSDSKPDIILLHGGTNDLGGSITGGDAANRLDAFLGKIFTDLPNTKVVLAQIIPMNDTALDAQRAVYNAAMPGLVSKYTSQGRTIRLVNMSSLLQYPADYADFLHPNQQGYDKMANAWYTVVTELYNFL